jgi:4-hydroxy-tetrahydrodipicolinate synthase
MIQPRSIFRLEGYAPALPTPFDAGGDVDLAALECLCHLQIDAGATALVVCGTTGEAPTLAIDEHRDIVSIAVAAAAGRVPVIAGAGSNATTHAIELARVAEAEGADALLSVVPYYNKPTQAGITAHFRAIAQETTLPIILYDVPSRTARAIEDDTTARLAENPRFAGLKDATGDLARVLRLRELVGDDFRLLSGDDATALAFIAQGGDGCISVTANILPGLCRDAYLASKQGDIVALQRLSVPVMNMTAALFRETNPVPLKFALSRLGLISADVRLPLVQLGAQNRAELAAIIDLISARHAGGMIQTQAKHAIAAQG